MDPLGRQFPATSINLTAEPYYFSPCTVCRGFCKHASPSFAGWHRPYVWAFEQGLIKHATNVVNRIKDEEIKEQYAAILPCIRLPYW
jgi:hypothetical protein